MKHNIPPESSGSAAVAIADSPDPPDPTSHPGVATVVGFASEPDTPGPISWDDLPATEPVTLLDLPETQLTNEPGAGVEPVADELLADLAERLGLADPPQAVIAAGAVEPPTPSVWSLGPVGRCRSIALLVALSIATVGLFAVVWFARANREMREFDPRMHSDVLLRFAACGLSLRRSAHVLQWRRVRPISSAVA